MMITVIIIVEKIRTSIMIVAMIVIKTNLQMNKRRKEFEIKLNPAVYLAHKFKLEILAPRSLIDFEVHWTRKVLWNKRKPLK